jgi:hypothetical protein
MLFYIKLFSSSDTLRKDLVSGFPIPLPQLQGSLFPEYTFKDGIMPQIKGILFKITHTNVQEKVTP